MAAPTVCGKFYKFRDTASPVNISSSSQQFVHQCFQVLSQGHPCNEGFLLTLKTLFMLPRVLSLEMHSKRRYKICICSIIQGPGNLGLIKITSAFISIIFSANFRYNLTYYESENFSESSPHHIFECENFRLPFCYEK